MCSILDTSQSQWPCSLEARVYGRSFPGIGGLGPAGLWMSVFCGCCVWSGRGLCNKLITHPEESYRVWCVWVWSWGLNNEEALAHKGLSCHGKKTLDTNSPSRAAVSWIPFCNVNMVNPQKGTLNSPYILKALWSTLVSGAHMGPDIEDAPSADAWLNHWSVAGSTFCMMNYILMQFQGPAPLWHTNFISLFSPVCPVLLTSLSHSLWAIFEPF